MEQTTHTPVTKEIELESGSESQSNSVYYLLQAIKSYSSMGEYNRCMVAEKLAELHSKIGFNDGSWKGVGRVLQSSGLRRAAFYVIDNGAVTLLLMRLVLGFSLGSAVRYLEDLRTLNILKPTTKLLRPRDAKGGPRVVVYQTPDAKVDQIQRICDLHRRYEDPFYARALEDTRSLLRDKRLAKGGELSYGDVVDYLRGEAMPRDVQPLAERVCRILLESGVRVWRR